MDASLVRGRMFRKVRLLLVAVLAACGLTTPARGYYAELVTTLPVGGIGLQTAMDGDTIAVGIPTSSRVVIFVRDSTGAWVEEERLDRTETPPLGRPSRFGRLLALDGDTLFVAGSSDIWGFHRSGGVWTEEMHDPSTTSLNGIWDVAADGEYVVASRGTSSMLGMRRASDGTWSYPWIRGGTSDSMHGIAIENGVVATGFPNARPPGGRGLVRLYRIVSGSLSSVADVTGGSSDEDFGEALALSPDGTTLFVGATDAPRPGTTAPWQGAVDVFSIGASSVTSLNRLRPGGPASLFGDTIGTEDGFAVVGGSPVRLFALQGGAWTYQDTLIWSFDLPRVDMSGRFIVAHNQVFEIMDGTGLGIACDASSPCGRGDCVDGLCCDDACAGATTGCQGCSLATGASHDGRCTTIADGTSCDGSLACTEPGMCMSGACTAGPAVSCDDGNPCTTDTCDEPAGCSHEPIVGCSAGDAGTDGGTRDAAADAAPGDAMVTGDGGGGADADVMGMDDGGGTTGDGGGTTGDGGGSSARRGGGCAVSSTGFDGSLSFALIGLVVFLARRRLRVSQEAP